MKQLLTSLMLLTALLASAQEDEQVTTYTNYLVTADGTIYPIDNPADFESANHSTSNSVGDYSFSSNSGTVTVARANVKSVTLEIPLTRASETYFCGYLFYGCSSLTEANITFGGGDECTSVGTYFCYDMFYNCSGLVSLPDTFNLPQGITSMGTYFCAYMFYGCKGLVSLPDNFNLPQGITGSVTQDFCHGMFSGCSGLVSLPDNFNLPQGITSVGAWFCYYMFSGCSGLVSLPDNFNLPQGITSVGSYFCQNMFSSCSNLSTGETVELTFPREATNVFSSTNISPTTASAGDTYKLKGNSEVYYTIKYYDQEENLIKIVHIEIPEQGNSVTIGDFAIDGTTLVDDDNYAFRGWCYESGKKASVEDVVSENINLYAYITEIEKADGKSTYEYDLTQEYFYAEDHDCFDYDEDGNIVLTIGSEAYVVVETSDETITHYYQTTSSQEITLAETSISKITIYNVADLTPLTFASGGLIYTITGGKNVEITAVEESVTEFEISTTVKNDGIKFTVKSIANDAFNGLEGLTLTIDFDDPEAILFDQIATIEGSNKLGVLIVEKGSLWDFYNSNWSTYFTITPDVTFTLSDDYGTYTYTVDQTDNAVVLTNFDGDYIIIEEAIENVVEYEGQIFTIKSVANDALTEVVLWVPRDELSVYEQYEEIFAEINGTPDLYIDGIYYNFIYSDDETEELSLKARTVSLEVTNGPEAYEGDITIPETVSVHSVDLGEDAEVTYEVTSLSSTAFKDCTDLTSVTLESSVPLENADALNQVPESCVIVVEDEATRTAYSAILTSVTVYTEEEYKAIVSGITIKVIDKVELERYNLLGQKVNTPVRGINIIKYSDGSVEKVLVK